MKVNPLDARNSSKGKSKDIHLTNIDVTFGSNRILSGANLTLAYGRRYGLIGRNGVGKSTLLRNIALRELAVPSHITILFVEQEVMIFCKRGVDGTHFVLIRLLEMTLWPSSLCSRPMCGVTIS